MQKNRNQEMFAPASMYQGNMMPMPNMNMPMPMPNMNMPAQMPNMPNPQYEIQNIVNRLNVLEKRMNILESNKQPAQPNTYNDSNFYIV